MEPRVDLLDLSSAPLAARPYFEAGDPGPIVATLATVPELLGPTLAFVGQALGPGAAGARHTEFAILRTSALQGCQFCIRSHTAASLDVGLSVDEIRALRGELDLDVVFADPAERALLTWIDAMAGATGPIPDQVYDAARLHFAEHLLVELATTIGATLFLNRFATCFRLPTSAEVDAALRDAGLDDPGRDDLGREGPDPT
jgi:AhpD family alkylhydroperoxidase